MRIQEYRDHVDTVGAQAAIDETLERISGHPAFVTVLHDDARRRAELLDALPTTHRGRLHGVAIAIKDDTAYAGTATGLGVANPTIATVTAPPVKALEDEGAVIVGKTRLPGLAAWPATAPLDNPAAPGFDPGGSSGGSAVAVAAGLVPAALGSDGGGSLRIPAANTGIVGFKPSYGLIPTEGWDLLSSIGPLAHSVADAALLVDIMAGTTTSSEPHRIRFSLVTKTVIPVDREHAAAAVRVADRLRARGHRAVPAPKQLPNPTSAFVPLYLAGVRDMPVSNRPNIARIGARMPLAVERYGRRQRQRIITAVDELFNNTDLIITPTLAATAPQTGEWSGVDGVLGMVKSVPYVAFTSLFNVSGHPALSIPAGIHSGGAPIGVQLAARDEQTLLDVAEQVTAM